MAPTTSRCTTTAAAREGRNLAGFPAGSWEAASAAVPHSALRPPLTGRRALRATVAAPASFFWRPL